MILCNIDQHTKFQSQETKNPLLENGFVCFSFYLIKAVIASSKVIVIVTNYDNELN